MRDEYSPPSVEGVPVLDAPQLVRIAPQVVANADQEGYMAFVRARRMAASREERIANLEKQVSFLISHLGLKQSEIGNI